MNLSRRQFAAVSLAATLGGRALAQRLPREVPWLKEIQTPPDEIPSDAPELLPLLVDADKQPIRTRVHWEKHREYLRRQWLDLIGEVRPRERLVQQGRIPPTFEIRDSAQFDGIVRRRIRYETERGVKTEAYLLMPQKPRRRLPGGGKESSRPRAETPASFPATCADGRHRPAWVDPDVEACR